MARKASTEASEKRFYEAQAQINRIPVDHKDPIYNVGVATNNFTSSVHFTLNELVAVINEMSERLERVENLLKNMSTGPLTRTLR